MPELIGLEKLPVEVRKKIIPFMEELIAIHKDNIRSVFIYGSATGIDYRPKISDINSAIVFKSLQFLQFQNSLSVISSGIKQKFSAPLFLTLEYIHSSLDVFPLEFSEMKENHVLIYGEDVLSTLEIPQQYIRLFCEQQIKGKLIRIRQAYLEVGLNHKGMEALLKDSLTSLLPVFRALIRMKKTWTQLDKTKILEELCEEFKLDKSVFLTIFRHTRQEELILRNKMDFFTGEYLKQLEKIAQAIEG